MNQIQTTWCEQIYEAKASGLILYGRALGLSHSEAEDVLQETFVTLLKLENQPKEPEHYCFRSYRNRAINYRRGLWRRLARELESSRWFERENSESPFEKAAMRCLSELSVDQRETIVLKIWNGMTFEEIGELLDCSPNTIAGRYRYGLEKIRKCLNGEGYEQNEHTGKTIGIMESTSPVIGS